MTRRETKRIERERINEARVHEYDKALAGLYVIDTVLLLVGMTRMPVVYHLAFAAPLGITLIANAVCIRFNTGKRGDRK